MAFMCTGQWAVSCARDVWLMLCVVALCQVQIVMQTTSRPVPEQQETLSLRRAFLGLHKCNACVGTSICKKLFQDHIRFDWWVSPGQALPLDERQSFIGNLTDDSLSWHPVLLSFLSPPHQHNSSDQFICLSSRKQRSCSIEAVLRASHRFKAWRKSHLLLPHMVQGLAPPLLRCPSQRLLHRVVRRYAEVLDVGSVQMKHFTERDKLRLLYTLAVNQQPLILQMFPSTEGWPFPRYRGACGRLMVWSSSRPLSSLYEASVEQRADAAYQLLQVTEALGSNSQAFMLYYTQLEEDMFGLLEDGRLVISNVSTIGVIDLEQGLISDPPSPSVLDDDVFSCLGQGAFPCVRAPPCSSVRPTQSFTLLCRNHLPKLLVGATRQGEARHEEGTETSHLADDVASLLRVCADASQPDWRIFWAVESLKDRLSPLRPCRPDYGYRYPECHYNQRY